MPEHLPIQVFTVICDDIRQEILGKITIAGMYSEHIFVVKCPTRLRSLAFFTRFRGGNGTTFTAKPRVKSPSGEFLQTPDVSTRIRFPAGNDSEYTSLGAVLGSVELKEVGPYSYEIYLDDTPEPMVSFPFNVTVRPEIFQRS